MTASHHPSEDLLLSYASGSLDESSSILVATHLALCPSCRSAVSLAEDLGGELFDEIEPVAMSNDSLNSVLSFLEENPDCDENDSRLLTATLSKDFESFPQPLKSYLSSTDNSLEWRWLGPGVRAMRIAHQSEGPKISLLRISPGKKMPMHGHSSDEMTMVLSGGYSDAIGQFARGDVEVADNELVHQPVSDPGEECICLVVTKGELRPTGVIPRILQSFVSI